MSQFTNINNKSLNKQFSNDNAKEKHKTCATVTKSNITADNDFLKTLIAQLMQNIIENLSVIVNSPNVNSNELPLCSVI